MARTTHFTHDELERAEKLRDEATTVAEFRIALSVLLMADGRSAEQTAELLGTSRSTIFRNCATVRNKEDAHSKGSWGGRRRFSLTIEEERKFLADWESEATTGGVISVPPIHAALVKLIEHDTPPSTTYRMLARHGWRKVQPDTKHHKSDPLIQDEWKKNSRKWWRPPV